VIPSNSTQCRFYDIRYKEQVALVKTLEAEKRELNKKEISNKRASITNAKAKKVKVKKLLGKQSTSETLIRTLEKVFECHCISKPYYHGGKYNGKSMVNFMTDSGRIMDDIKEALLQIDQGSRYCNDEEIISFTEKYTYILQVFDGLFLKCRIASCHTKENDISRKKEKKTRIDNEKRNVRMTTLATPMECEGVYCRSGHQRNKDDFLVMMWRACDQIAALCRGQKAQKLSIKLKKPTIIITKVCRGKMARNIARRIRDGE
jgi:hypothetical protein